jgi:hypothetical protein
MTALLQLRTEIGMPFSQVTKDVIKKYLNEWLKKKQSFYSWKVDLNAYALVNRININSIFSTSMKEIIYDIIDTNIFIITIRNWELKTI